MYTLHDTEWDFVISEIQRISKPDSIIVISNLNKDFKAVSIYKDHIRKSLKTKGMGKTIWELATLIYPTFKIIQFNKVISGNDEIGRYSFLSADEQELKFKKYSLISLTGTENVYSGQAYMNVFKNKKSTT